MRGVKRHIENTTAQRIPFLKIGNHTSPASDWLQLNAKQQVMLEVLTPDSYLEPSQRRCLPNHPHRLGQCSFRFKRAESRLLGPLFRFGN